MFFFVDHVVRLVWNLCVDYEGYVLESGSFTRECWYWGVLISGDDDVSLLERCPHFRGWYVLGFNGVGT